MINNMSEEELKVWLHQVWAVQAGVLCVGHHQQVVSPLLSNRNAAPCTNSSWQICGGDNLYWTSRTSPSPSSCPLPFQLLIPKVYFFLFSGTYSQRKTSGNIGFTCSFTEVIRGSKPKPKAVVVESNVTGTEQFI